MPWLTSSGSMAVKSVTTMPLKPKRWRSTSCSSVALAVAGMSLSVLKATITAPAPAAIAARNGSMMRISVAGLASTAA